MIHTNWLSVKYLLYYYQIMQKLIKNYPQKSFDHAVTAVDVVLFTVSENNLKVLLLKLKEKPFEQMWALPGGLVTKDETLLAAAHRHLKTKLDIKESAHIEQLYTFGDPNRDPNGWVVSVAYMALVQNDKINPRHSDRYGSVQWYPVTNLPKLAYDHNEIIKTALERLQAKATYTNIIYTLMPKEFTLTNLQNMYETILNKKIDKRNFRKKIISLNILKNLRRKSPISNRPAELYSFKEQKLQETNLV